jgi:hypothetical protein
MKERETFNIYADGAQHKIPLRKFYLEENTRVSPSAWN